MEKSETEKEITQFKNLIFEGGGIKGIAYVGAMKVLESKGILPRIERVGGTSAGGIYALFTALGYAVQDLEDEMLKSNFEDFKDDTFGFIRDAKRIVEEYGYFRGDAFKNWIGGFVRDKLGYSRATFKDLHDAVEEQRKTKNGEAPTMKELYICVTNLSTGFNEILSHETRPDMPLMQALRMTMSVPFVFKAVKDRKTDDIFVDGGVQNNYPIKMFDRDRFISASDKKKGAARKTNYYKGRNTDGDIKNHCFYNCQTLGLRVDTPSEIATFLHGEHSRRDIDDLLDYAYALALAAINTQSNYHLHSDDWQRTVYIECPRGVGTLKFDLTNKQKMDLVESGKKFTEDYFKWFCAKNGKVAPVNRI